MGISPAAAFWFVYDHMTFMRVDSYVHNGKTYYGGAVTKNAHLIKFVHLMNEGFPVEPNPDLGPIRGTNHLIHELGHAFASTWFGKTAYGALQKDMMVNNLLRRDNLRVGHSYGFASGYHYYYYHFADGNASHQSEIFADMFVGYVTGEWFNGEYSYQGYGVPLSAEEKSTYMNMAEEKSSWINTYMNGLVGR
jgi:hypothetical protein